MEMAGGENLGENTAGNPWKGRIKTWKKNGKKWKKNGKNKADVTFERCSLRAKQCR